MKYDLPTTSDARLRELLQRLKVVMAEIDAEICGEGVVAPPPVGLREIARRIYRQRRRRDKMLGSEIFADPAWDIMLDLYSRLESVSISAACIGAAVPVTTALRWIAELQRRGMVQRRSDAQDRRRMFIELTPVARKAMSEYLQGVTIA